MYGQKNKFCYDRKAIIRASELESIVETALLKHIKSLPAKSERMKAKHFPRINELQIETEKVDSSIEKLLNQLETAEGALVRYINDRVNEYDRKRQALSSELIQLTVEANKPIDGGLNLDDIVSNWDNLDVEQKNIVLKTFVKKIFVYDDKIQFKLSGGGNDKDEEEETPIDA